MSKTQVALASLVAVIPGAFLFYILVMALLFSENLPTMAYVVMGGALLASAITVLIPAGVLIGGGRKRAPAKPSKKSQVETASGDIDDSAAVMDASSELEAESIDGVLEESDDGLDLGGDDDSIAASSEFELGISDDDISVALPDQAEIDTEAVDEYHGGESKDSQSIELRESMAIDDVDLDDSLELGDSMELHENALDFDDFDLDDEPKPKKKKN